MSFMLNPASAVPIRVLIVEDRAADAELMSFELRRAGFNPTWVRVETEAQYSAALGPHLDVVLADYSLPTFSAPKALDILLGRRLDVPFIVVTGTVGEEPVIECLKKGAADYLLKDRLARLGPAVSRALDARVLRNQKLAAEEGLRFQARLLDVVEHAVVATAPSGAIVYWNRAAERLYGWTTAEALGRNVAETLTTGPGNARMAEMLAGVASGESWSGEFLVRRRDGVTFAVHMTQSPVHDDAGELLGIIGVSYDITERKRTEQEIRDLAKFPAENPHPILRVWRDGTLRYANRASQRVLEAWGTAVGEQLPAFLQASVRDVMACGVKREVEAEVGSQLFSVLLVPIVEGGYCNLYVQDITERRRAERLLRESEERLRLITENVLDMVSQVALDGTFLYVSPSHELALGYTPESMLGTCAFSYVHPDDREPIEADLAEAIDRRTTKRFEFRYRHADGRYLDLEAVGRLVFDANGSPCGAVLSARDVTERKRLERDLRRRTEELERFNRLAVGREVRMIELKKQVNELSEKLRLPPPYSIVDDCGPSPAQERSATAARSERS